MNDEQPVLVSIICITYNHEPYIRDALDGFLMQKTSFKYEILVHDDASTDKTADIIREYEKMYPDVIKPIYQVENQFSKGVRISKEFLYPRAQGKYIASCEGDDYWTDELKLQKQVDYLETHPECSICVHQASFFSFRKKRTSLVTQQDSDRDYTVEEIILGGGEQFATNSIVAKKSVFTTMPECFSAKGFGDYQLFIYGAILGRFHYFADNMSTYRCGIPGSWTQRTMRNKEKLLEHRIEFIRMLKAVDGYYNGKYHETIQNKIDRTEFENLKLKSDLIRIHNKKYVQFYNEDIARGYSPVRACLANAFPRLVLVKGRFRKFKNDVLSQLRKKT